MRNMSFKRRTSPWEGAAAFFAGQSKWLEVRAHRRREGQIHARVSVPVVGCVEVRVLRVAEPASVGPTAEWGRVEGGDPPGSSPTPRSGRLEAGAIQAGAREHRGRPELVRRGMAADGWWPATPPFRTTTIVDAQAASPAVVCERDETAAAPGQAGLGQHLLPGLGRGGGTWSPTSTAAPDSLAPPSATTCVGPGRVGTHIECYPTHLPQTERIERSMTMTRTDRRRRVESSRAPVERPSGIESRGCDRSPEFRAVRVERGAHSRSVGDHRLRPRSGHQQLPAGDHGVRDRSLGEMGLGREVRHFDRALDRDDPRTPD